jgi:hypothetical protein
VVSIPLRIRTGIRAPVGGGAYHRHMHPRRAHRQLSQIFWVSSYKELADRVGRKWVGIFVLTTQLAHVGIMADFFYYYIR